MRFMSLAAPALVGALTVGSVTALGIGDSLPSSHVKMTGVDGNAVSIAQVAGDRGTLVMFSCNACPWAKAWEQRITEIGNTYREKGIGVIMINSNDPQQVPEDGFEEMQRRAAKLGVAFPYVVDATSDVARAFGASRTPEVFLFDSGGTLIYHGTIDDNAQRSEKVSKHYLKDALEAQLAGRPISPTETKALGCTIKFR